MAKSDTITLYSAIKPSLLRKYLLRGTLIAGIGILPLLYAGIWLDAEILSRWGASIFFGSLAMIALGLLPYRRLTALERNPNKLVFNGNQQFTYYQKGKRTFSVPFSAIKKTAYLENGDSYGISLDLEEQPERLIIVHNRYFDFSRYRKHCRRRHTCDLFLPYFSRSAFLEMESILEK